MPDLPGRKFQGQVQFIAPVIDPASGEFRVKILLANQDRLLRSGMTALGYLELTHLAPPENQAMAPKSQPAAR